MGYFEPIEFASFGLLAVAFVSISSPQDEMRKLGYEALGRFKNALEVVISIIMSTIGNMCYKICIKLVSYFE